MTHFARHHSPAMPNMDCPILRELALTKTSTAYGVYTSVLATSKQAHTTASVKICYSLPKIYPDL